MFYKLYMSFNMCIFYRATIKLFKWCLTLLQMISFILQALVASSFVPFYSGIFPAVFRGKVNNS